jgi:hypothetical protein
VLGAFGRVWEEDSSFSEEKEAKRLLSIKAEGLQPTITNNQKFFDSFFQERTTLLLDILNLLAQLFQGGL